MISFSSILIFEVKRHHLLKSQNIAFKRGKRYVLLAKNLSIKCWLFRIEKIGFLTFSEWLHLCGLHVDEIFYNTSVRG